MRDIDLCDGHLHICEMSRGCMKKYYQNIFQYMLDMSYCNTFIIILYYITYLVNSQLIIESVCFVI
jgi:hypothetical protein